MVLGRATGMRGFDTCSLSAFGENQGTDNGSSGAGPGRDWETTCPPNSVEPHQRHCGGMGFMYLNAAISRGRRDPRRSVRLLVDTGAWYSMVPRSLLQRLGGKPQWGETLRVPDGATETDEGHPDVCGAPRKCGAPRNGSVGLAAGRHEAVVRPALRFRQDFLNSPPRVRAETEEVVGPHEQQRAPRTTPALVHDSQTAQPR